MKTNKTEEKSLVDDFVFEGESFFNIEEEASEVEIETKVEEKSTKEELKSKSKPKKEKDLSEDSEEEPEESTEVFFEEEKEPEVFDTPFKNLVLDLKDKGIFSSVEITEEEDITEERFFELHEQEIDNRVDEVIEGFFEELDDDAKAFLKYKKEGGDTGLFLNYIAQKATVSSIEDIDNATDLIKENYLRNYYANVEGLDPEDIEDKLEFLKEKGKIDSYASKFFNKEKEVILKKEADLINEQKQAKQAEIDNRNNNIKELKQLLNEKEDLKNFKVTVEDKKTLVDFIYKPAIKTGKTSYITEFQKKLSEAFADKEKLLIIAKLLKSDFDTKDLVDKAKKEVTKEVKKSLSRISQDKNLSNSNKAIKSIADYF